MKLNTIFEDKIYLHSTLNSDIWEDDRLKPEVLDKLREIAMAFFSYLKIVNLTIEDIILTGSMCQFNYNDESDIDLHFVIDFNNLPADCPIPLDDYFNSKKKIFNDEHNIFIYGHPVELYVEDLNTPSKSNGKYSLLRDEWIDKPKLKNKSYEYDETKVNEIISEINEVLSSEYNIEKANELMNKIYSLRKEGLEKSGEFSEGNIIFKLLRNQGYIKQLNDYISKYDDMSLSLY